MSEAEKNMTPEGTSEKNPEEYAATEKNGGEQTGTEQPASPEMAEKTGEEQAGTEQQASPETDEKTAEGKRKKEKVKRTVGQEILSWIWTLLAAFAIALVIRAVLFEPVRVDGHSMDDTLADQEIMLISKFDYSSNWLSFPWQSSEAQEEAPRLTLGGNPQRNDIVVCRYPNRGATNFVKRVVGLPGETIRLTDGYVYINGEKQEENFLNDDYRSGTLNEMNDYTIPKKGDILTFAEQGTGRYVVCLNGNAFELRQTRLFCKDSEGKDMIFASLSGGEKQITYQGKKYSSKETEFANLLASFTGKEFTVDRDYFFLMGDHRNNSNDSRNVGAVDRSMIVGHVRQIVFPFNKWRSPQ